jgi:hypothetical protein
LVENTGFRGGAGMAFIERRRDLERMVLDDEITASLLAPGHGLLVGVRIIHD